MIVYYSDNFVINESENGFTFNFFKDETDIELKVDYQFRIGMSPLSTKKFFFALYRVIGEFEEKFGEIKFNPATLRKLVREEQAPIGFRLIESSPKERES